MREKTTHGAASSVGRRERSVVWLRNSNADILSIKAVSSIGCETTGRIVHHVVQKLDPYAKREHRVGMTQRTKRHTKESLLELPEKTLTKGLRLIEHARVEKVGTLTLKQRTVIITKSWSLVSNVLEA